MELPEVVTLGRSHGEAKEVLQDAPAAHLAWFDSAPGALAPGAEPKGSC